MIKKKRGIAMSFNWMFAIIAGGIILFLAIFAAGKFVKTSTDVFYTETAASLISFFDPLETGLASGKAQKIEFEKNSRLLFECHENIGIFGKQTVSFSEQTFGSNFGESGQEISIKNKYVFADDVVEGKEIFAFSKPFFLGFKVSDLTMIISSEDTYCFYDSPKNFKEDLEGLNLENLIFPDEEIICEGIDVCFDNKEGCDIDVVNENGFVLDRRYGKRVYYVDNLIYGAIFSSPENYECNINRLKSRYDQLVNIYLNKIQIIEKKGCSSNIGSQLINSLGELRDSRGLIALDIQVQEIEKENKLVKPGCQLFYNDDFEKI